MRVVWDDRALDISGPAEADEWRHMVRVDVVELDSLHPAVADWIVRHEGCHLDGMRGELIADCCAMHRMYDDRIVSDLDVAEIVSYVSALEAGPVHPPGVVRALVVLGCQERTPAP